MHISKTLAVLALLLLPLSAHPVMAADMCANPHCYGEADSENATANVGSHVGMYVSSGAAADTGAGGFIEQTLWQGTDNQSQGGTYWVEAGYTYGWEGQNVRTFYWADDRPNSNPAYHEHEVTSITPQVGYWYPIDIVYSGNSAWAVDINNTNEGLSTANPCCGRFLQTGVESTNSGSNLQSDFSAHMEYRRQSDNTWTSSWDGSTSVWYTAGSPAYAHWSSGLEYVQVNDWFGN